MDEGFFKRWFVAVAVVVVIMLGVVVWGFVEVVLWLRAQ